MNQGRLLPLDRGDDRDDEAMCGVTAPMPAIPVRVTPAAKARFAWPLTGSWSLTPGTPW
jgi:hypothetical protein